MSSRSFSLLLFPLSISLFFHLSFYLNMYSFNLFRTLSLSYPLSQHSLSFSLSYIYLNISLFLSLCLFISFSLFLSLFLCLSRSLSLCVSLCLTLSHSLYIHFFLSPFRWYLFQYFALSVSLYLLLSQEEDVLLVPTELLDLVPDEEDECASDSKWEVLTFFIHT